MELYLIRHGETLGNKKGVYLGWTNDALSDTGRAQMEKLRAQPTFPLCTVDPVYVSPLTRAMESAVLLFGETCTLDVRDALRERNFGLFENHTYAEIEALWLDEVRRWNAAPWEYAPPSGESGEAFHARIVQFTEERIIQERMKHKAIAVCTHAGVIRTMVAHLLGLPPEGIWRFFIDNGTCARLSIDEAGYAFLRL